MSARLSLILSRLTDATTMRSGAGQAPGWSRQALAGRLVEISGQGATSSLTAVASLILDAQVAGEPCAWVTRSQSTFFPPDLACNGIDLESLVLVFVSSVPQAARATARLVHSGAFGLVVADLGSAPEVSLAIQGRLAGLALQHDAAVILLTEKPASAPSIGSLVSLRAEARRIRIAEAHFQVQIAILKDKRHGPGWTHQEACCGPAGLR